MFGYRHYCITMKLFRDCASELDSAAKHDSMFGNHFVKKGGSFQKERFSFLFQSSVGGMSLTLDQLYSREWQEKSPFATKIYYDVTVAIVRKRKNLIWKTKLGACSVGKDSLWSDWILKLWFSWIFFVILRAWGTRAITESLQLKCQGSEMMLVSC